MKDSIFHYNDKTKNYKSLDATMIDDRSGVFFSMMEGNKPKNEKNRITLKLGRAEIAYLIMELTKIYNDL